MHKLFSRTALTLVGTLLSAQALLAAPQAYDVDPAHSSINFSVRHFFSPVQGNFKKFVGEIKYDPSNVANSEVSFTVQSDSISTDTERRDTHLKSADFFDVAKYPTLTFQSKKVTSGGKNKLNVIGDMTIHGVTKPVTVVVTVLGTGKGMDGSPIAGFETNFEVNRKEYGIVWNKNLDGGGTMLGDDVNVKVTVEAHAKK